uniref:Reverse transcriptase domain-containing protein n=1 Tax=Tanacetum cinerariifolium TaxID=118510 RepID=A0A699ISR8_TANCI|nr:reverse transcriptase domain-containing protein [Tanacetum cinerariifolium]
MPREWIAIIESKSKVRYSCNKPVVAKVSMNTSTSGILPNVAELKDMVKALLLNKKSQNQAPATVKAVKESSITTQSGVSYDGPQIPHPPSFLPKVVENKPEATKDTVTPPNNGSTKDIQPPVVLTESLILNSEPVNYLIIEPIASSFFQDMSFKISFADALILLLKFASTLKALIGNKEKLSEMARTPLNEHCSAVLLKKLPKQLGDPGKFLIPCDFTRMDEYLALADLGASINLMPLSVWKRLSLPGELTLRVGKEAITFNLDQTSRYSANYNDNSINQIDVIEMACEEYSQEVLGFFDVIASGNPTPYYDPIVSTTSLTLTPFRNSDYLLEEVDAFLALEDDPTLPKVNQSYLDSKGDILLLEAFLNDDPSLPPPNQGNYRLDVRKELKICEAKSDKSSIDEPPEKTMEVFMDDFSVFGNSFQSCLSYLEKMLKRPIQNASKTMTEAESNYTTTEKEMLAVVYAFEKFWSYLIMNKSIMYTDHFALKYLFAKKDSKAKLLRWVLLLQEFTFKVIDTKRAENLAADHLS